MDVAVTIGDLTTTAVGETFSVVYLVFNTIMKLTTQAARVASFRNTAAHLDPGGCFVIEVPVPRVLHLAPGGTYHAFHVSELHVSVWEKAQRYRRFESSPVW